MKTEQSNPDQGAVLLIVIAAVAALFMVVVTSLVVVAASRTSSRNSAAGLVARMAADSALDVCLGAVEDFRRRHTTVATAMITVNASPDAGVLDTFIRSFDDCTEPQGRLGTLRRSDRRSIFSAACDVTSTAVFPYRGMGSQSAGLTYLATSDIELGSVVFPTKEDLAGGPKDCGGGTWVIHLFGDGVALQSGSEPFPPTAEMLAWGVYRLSFRVNAELDARRESILIEVYFPDAGKLAERRFRCEGDFPDMPKWNWSKLSLQ